jgi:hypothetical protein
MGTLALLLAISQGVIAISLGFLTHNLQSIIRRQAKEIERLTATLVYRGDAAEAAMFSTFTGDEDREDHDILLDLADKRFDAKPLGF